MSRQPDKYTCAETLVHETQHLKLCALLDLVTLARPDDGRRYYAPWRPDPRPAGGLLQGAYAFLGVSGFVGRARLCQLDRLTAGALELRPDRGHTRRGCRSDRTGLINDQTTCLSFSGCCFVVGRTLVTEC